MGLLALLLVTASGTTLAQLSAPVGAVTYDIDVSTGWSDHAGTSRPNISLIISGTNGTTERLYLLKQPRGSLPDFGKGSLHHFQYEAADIGQVSNITILFGIWGQDDRWFLENVFIKQGMDNEKIYAFAFHAWLHKDTAYKLSDPCVMSSCLSDTGSSCQHKGLSSEVYMCTCNSDTLVPLCSTESKCQYQDGWFHPEGSSEPGFRCSGVRHCQHPAQAAILESTQELSSVAQCLCRGDVSGFFARLKVNKGTKLSPHTEDCKDSPWCYRWRYCLRKETFSRAYCSRMCGYCEKGWIPLGYVHSYRLVPVLNNGVNDVSCVVSCDDYEIRVLEVGCFGANEFHKPALCKTTPYGNDGDLLSCLTSKVTTPSPDPARNRTSSTPTDSAERTSVDFFESASREASPEETASAKTAQPLASETNTGETETKAGNAATRSPAVPTAATTVIKPTWLVTLPESTTFTTGTTTSPRSTARSQPLTETTSATTSRSRTGLLLKSSTYASGTTITARSVASPPTSTAISIAGQTSGTVSELVSSETVVETTATPTSKASYDHSACMKICAGFATTGTVTGGSASDPTSSPNTSAVSGDDSNDSITTTPTTDDDNNKKDQTTTSNRSQNKTANSNNTICFPVTVPGPLSPAYSSSSTTRSPTMTPRSTPAEDVRKELRIDVASLSRTRSRRTSAHDDRKSCQAAGYIAVVFLCAVTLVVVQADLKRVYDTLKRQREVGTRPSKSVA